MILQSLHLLQFKNYPEATFRFVDGVNCFAGNNGVGKTNILDAIYYLSFCKSFTNTADSQNIRFDQDFFMIQGQYDLNGKSDEIYCGVKKNQKKIFKRNKNEYERLSDHIGLYPLVLIHPGDGLLITGGSEERRKFVDAVISQYNKEYLLRLIDYNKALTQRNALLKLFAEKRYFDEASLEIWDQHLITNGTFIHKVRTEFFNSFRPVFTDDYSRLSSNNESIAIEYESTLHEVDFEKALIETRRKDMALQYTNTGIHKDNLMFMLSGQPIKKFGSQGQQKTFVIALKMAQYRFISQIKGFKPVLLFDDIFDKLDPQRVELLVRMVSEEDFGQVFITDTHKQRLEEIMLRVKIPTRMFDIAGGDVAGFSDLN